LGLILRAQRDASPSRKLILGDKLKPDDGDREQSEGDDQRAERVCEMDVIRRGFEARQEAGKAGSRREPVDQRNADEYDADNAENPWHWPSHDAGLAEA
jgi:hypothetical protein